MGTKLKKHWIQKRHSLSLPKTHDSYHKMEGRAQLLATGMEMEQK